jgi:endonuclease/exonuclease/phosphatase family metal-dependent hydrolase
MKVLTFNIQGQENWANIAALGSTISSARADIVLLQEVMLDGSKSQAQLLRKSTGYTYMSSVITRFYQSSKTGKKFYEGLTTLSIYPIIYDETIILTPLPGDKHQRIVQKLVLRCPDGDIGVANIHLSNRQAYAEEQLDEALGYLGLDCIIIGGYFNLYDLTPLKKIDGYTLAYDTCKYVTNKDKRDGKEYALDHLLVRGSYTINCVDILGQVASDRDPVLADISFLS